MLRDCYYCDNPFQKVVDTDAQIRCLCYASSNKKIEFDLNVLFFVLVFKLKYPIHYILYIPLLVIVPHYDFFKTNSDSKILNCDFILVPLSIVNELYVDTHTHTTHSLKNKYQ